MAIAYEFDDRVLVLRLEGEYESADVEDAVVLAAADPACPPEPVLLLDMRRSRSLPSRTVDEIRRTAQFMAVRAARLGGRLGMVVEGGAALARIRLAQAVMQSGGVAAEAFTDVAPARAWLLSGVPPRPAPRAAVEAFALAQRRAASDRRGSARCVSDGAGGWLVISEQPLGADGWQLVVDAPDGEQRIEIYPAQWMLLSERELLDLIGRRPADEAEAPSTADVGVFAMRLDGFEATVEYDEAAEEFRGEVVNATGPIRFTGRTAAELRTAFREALDRYRAPKGDSTT